MEPDLSEDDVTYLIDTDGYIDFSEFDVHAEPSSVPDPDNQ